MRLIADSGSTKTAWCSLSKEGEKSFFSTEGYNPYFASKEFIENSLQRNFPPDLDKTLVTHINFYGAGCAAEKSHVINTVLSKVFPNAEITVSLDLLAAARALLGRTAGFAAILGTGTNTCTYDGENITLNIDSLGYILGDEGSASFMGKKILSDFIRGKMPIAVKNLFTTEYQLTAAQIISKTYSEGLANRFCASFSRFLSHPEIDREYADAIVYHAFRQFFKELVASYPDFTSYSFNCIGSIAYHFSDILTKVAAEFGMKTGKIIPSVIEDLAEYHMEPI